MSSVRRWYVLIICTVSLQAIAWGAITLLRGMLPGGNATTTATAFRLAVLLVGLPIFLAHWLWEQRIAQREPEERESGLRHLYLYGNQAGFLAPFAVNGFYLLGSVLSAFAGETHRGASLAQAVIQNLVAMAVLALLWLYHQRVIAEDANTASVAEAIAPMRRLYVYGFTIAGLTLTALAFVRILNWLMFQIGPRVLSTTPTGEMARLIVGAVLWFVFWRWAGHLFHSTNAEERESTLRKVYLYAVVFITVLAAVSCATVILAGLLRRVLSLPSGGDIRTPLSITVAMIGLWVYHAHVLRFDATWAGEAPRQAGITRIYRYLMASVGLAALLVGLGGDISVLIRAVGGGLLGTGIKEQLAWFTAALLAGLPVWLLPWRQVQAEALEASPAGSAARHSITRKIYLYFYLTVAALSVLSSLVFILSRLLAQLLGARHDSALIGALAQAAAFALIGIGVWLYHLYSLRTDASLGRLEWAEKLAAWRVAVVDVGAGQLGRAVFEQLRQELPGLNLDPIGLTAAASATMDADTTDITRRLSEAQVIVGSWMIATPGTGIDGVSPEVASAVVASPARKILIPTRADLWEWAGVDLWKDDALVRQAAHAVRQTIEDKMVKPVRPLGAATIIAIILGALFGLPLLTGLIYAVSNVRYLF